MQAQQLRENKSERKQAEMSRMADSFVRASYQRHRSSLRQAALVAEEREVMLNVVSSVSQRNHPLWFRKMMQDEETRSAATSRQQPVNGELKQVVIRMLELSLEEGDRHQAELAAEDLFGRYPDTAGLLGRLEALYGSQVSLLRRRYGIDYLGAREIAQGCVPMDIQFRQSNGMLYVADTGKGCVRRICPETGEQTILEGAYIKVQALFEGAGGELWLADAGRGKITAVDTQDRVLREIDIRKLLPHGEGNEVLRAGCVRGTVLYAILLSPGTKKRILVSVDLDNPVAATVHEFADGFAPLRLFANDDAIILYDWPGARGVSWNGREEKPLPSGFRHRQVRGLERVADCSVLVSGESLIKLSEEGTVVFEYALSDITSLEGVSPLSLTSAETDEGGRIFLTDGISGRILSFEVRA